MSRLRAFGARLFGLFRKRRGDEDLDAELRTHLQLLMEKNIRRGMTADEAQRAALQEFGGLEQIKEVYREQRGLAFLTR